MQSDYISFEEAKKKMEKYCVYQERSQYEVLQKLNSFSLVPLAKDEIMIHLISQDFINETRYAKAYTRGKFNQKKWGKKKILQGLHQKKISKYNKEEALSIIDEKQYLETLNALALQKLSSVKSQSAWVQRNKIYNYLYQKGFESELIYDWLNKNIK